MTDGDDHGRKYEVNSQRAHWSGYVLILGLVLELINAIIWYKGRETVAEMIAVLLIVGGVWGELFFGHRARSEGDKQLAQYEARTAEANAKALEAQAELEKFRTPRMLSPEQCARINEKMKEFAGQEFCGAIAIGASDGALLWRLIANTLRTANWVLVSHPGATGDPPHTSPITTGTGVMVMFALSGPKVGELIPRAKALAEAIAAEGIVAAFAPARGAVERMPNAIRIEIGAKP